MTIKLAPELEQTLRQRSAALGRPASALIREALQSWLDAVPAPQASPYALGESIFGRHKGPADLAETRKTGFADTVEQKQTRRRTGSGAASSASGMSGSTGQRHGAASR